MKHPDWDRLFAQAETQEGLFTAAQAAKAGYSAQLLVHHGRAGRFRRLRRGLYRLVHFPAGDHEELVAAWLWSEQKGVVSHQTALGLHGLSDVLPSQLHLTLPAKWRTRRFRVPDGVVLHHADVPPTARAWVGPVPMTTAARTLNDCAEAGLSPELLRQGAQQAIVRGLCTARELKAVAKALAPFGGLAE